MMTFLIRLHPHNQSQPCTPDWQLQGSAEEWERPFCRHEGGIIVWLGYLYQHQPCGSLWLFPWPFCRGHDFLPAVLELHRLLLMLVTFEEAFVTELILASTVHDPLHLTAEGLGFIWLLGLIQQAPLILRTLRKAAVVKVFWSNCVSRFRASVTSAVCYVRVCVWADAIWTAELLQYTPNPWWLLQTLYTCLELNLAADECGSASLFQICRSAFRMNKLTITAAVWQSLLNTRHSSSNQILKSLILRRIKVFFLYTGWVHLST